MQISLSGRVALVTGSTRGIGRAIAQQLAASGATVVVTGRDEARAIEVAAEIAAATGATVHGMGVDISDAAQAAAIVERVEKELGKLDILVNNAGVSGSAEQDLYSTPAWNRIMEINATGPFLGMKHAIPAMIAAGGGSIVNLSSVAGINGSDGIHMAYHSSKAAVRLMTKAAAVQHARHHIRVNSVHPGMMPAMRTSGRTADPATRERRLQSVPMRRAGEVDEVAYAILFLASDEASYITGSEIHVDGGATAV